MKSGGVGGGVPRATSYSRELAGAGKARVAWRAGRTAAEGNTGAAEGFSA